MLPRAGCQGYPQCQGNLYVVPLSCGTCLVCTLPPLGHLCIWLWSEQDTCPIWQGGLALRRRPRCPTACPSMWPSWEHLSALWPESCDPAPRTSVVLSGCVLPSVPALSLTYSSSLFLSLLTAPGPLAGTMGCVHPTRRAPFLLSLPHCQCYAQAKLHTP